MKLRWCLLFVIIALIGIASQQEVCLPNQEIVLRFTNDKVTSDDAQNAITIVKEQLLSIGANNIHVKEFQEEGRLKITYYSETDVVSIKELLSEVNNDIELGYVSSNQDEKPSKSPSKKSTNSYDIDVFEIQKQDTGSDLNGKYAIEIKSDNLRFFLPNLLVSIDDMDFITIDTVLKETYKFRKNSTIGIDHTSHKTPDGRAGPNVG